MKALKSISDIFLHPQAGKSYWNSGRSWEEEIIYFILADRFHDNHSRTPGKADKSRGFGSKEELQSSCGGTLKGIQNNLSYIKNLGCTALWISPVLENNSQSYHGYAVQNFLKVDPRFGSRKDLEELISEAHKKDMKVFLDVVLNHSGNNWFYQGAQNPVYNKGITYKFGDWHSPDFPIPVELREPGYYRRKGRILHWDEYPETQEGDFFSLKKFNNEESEAGLALQEILFKSYAYWIRETDCDGFRIDAAKHLGEVPAARFTGKIKEYARLLGKKSFFVFGEIAADDYRVANFLKPVYSQKEKRTYQGFDSALDFPLHFCLPKVIRGELPVSKLAERYESIHKNLPFSVGGGFKMVSFLDNHDQIEEPYKKRIAAQLNEKQLLAALGILYCLPGVPCLYYGTEQGLSGEGDLDACIREAMFDFKNKTANSLNQGASLFKELAALAELRRKVPELQAGHLVFPLVSDRNVPAKKDPGVLVMSRRLFDQEVLIAFNVSTNENRTVYVQSGSAKKSYRFLYGRKGSVDTIKDNNALYLLPLDLQPLEFIILK